METAVGTPVACSVLPTGIDAGSRLGGVIETTTPHEPIRIAIAKRMLLAMSILFHLSWLLQVSATHNLGTHRMGEQRYLRTSERVAGALGNDDE